MKTSSVAFNDFLQKIESVKKGGGVDLSVTEDLSIAVMNLISLEEHFFFTGVKTKKDDYFESSDEIRKIRKDLLGELVSKHEGETWCISKHLLSTTMRLIEVGNKLYSEDKKDDAKKMFDRAYKVYSIFWALKLKLIEGKTLKDEIATSEKWSLEDLVTRVADCCKE